MCVCRLYGSSLRQGPSREQLCSELLCFQLCVFQTAATRDGKMREERRLTISGVYPVSRETSQVEGGREGEREGRREGGKAGKRESGRAGERQRERVRPRG